MRFPYLIEVLAGAAIAFHAIAASSDEIATPYAQYAQSTNGRITIGQAIVIAERHVTGEAIEAELEREDGRMVYDVDVETEDGMVEVFIDPETVAVLRTGPDD